MRVGLSCALGGTLERKSQLSTVCETIARVAARRPRLWLVGALLLCLLSALLALRLDYRSDVTDLAPAPVRETLGRLQRLFGVHDQLLLLVTSPQPGSDEVLVSFATALRARLSDVAEIADISFGWGEHAVALRSAPSFGSAPLFARDEDIETLEELLTPAGMRRQLEKVAAHLGVPGLGGVDWVERDPLELRQFLLSRLQSVRRGLQFRTGSPHFLSDDGSALLVRITGTVHSSDLPRVRSLVNSVRDAAEELRRSDEERWRAIRVAETGGYALNVESELTMRADLVMNIQVSIVLVLALLTLAWRNFALLLASWAALSVGIVGGWGVFSLVRDELVVLALVSGAVLVALAIDFAIHLSEPLRRGVRVRLDLEAVVGAVRETGPSLCLAALTTVSGFVAFAAAGEGFLEDMGLLTACGIAVTFFATLTIFPAVLVLFYRPAESRPLDPRSLPAVDSSTGGWLARLAGSLGGASRRWPRGSAALALCVTLAAGALVALRPPEPESDLRQIHAYDSSAVETERRIEALFGSSEEPLLLLVSKEQQMCSRDEAIARGKKQLDLPAAYGLLDDVERLEHELEAASAVVADWVSPLSLLPSRHEQTRVLELLAKQDAAAVLRVFDEEIESIGFAPESFAAARQALADLLQRGDLLTLDEISGFGLSEDLATMVHSTGGQVFALLSVYPQVTLWQKGDQEKVFEALDAALQRVGVVGELTGLYAASAGAAEFVVQEFLIASGCALIVVVLLVFLLLRDGWLALCALTPVLLSCLVVSSIWSLFGFKLNFMNVGILPMILGIGIDDGIHIVTRYARHPMRDIDHALRSAGSAVILTSLTTLVAFGTLAFSVNRGLVSVGQLAACGILFAMLASLTILPGLLQLHRRWVGDKDTG